MPAVDRLAKEIFEAAREEAKRNPSPETYELAKKAASQMYGIQVMLAFIARGIDGVRAHQLLDEYEIVTAPWTQGPSIRA